ncbi:hypothetical protein, partial [Eisenbergiella porci]|uniref:hypothetical protein n=1 Tax=Eisenbergiella porci TaxID=2652274 RepID=UPI003A93F1EB
MVYGNCGVPYGICFFDISGSMARACMKNIPIVLMLTLISCREGCPAGRKKIRGGYAYAGSTA